MNKYDNQPAQIITVNISGDEANLLLQLRKFNYGTITISKHKGRVVRIEEVKQSIEVEQVLTASQLLDLKK